MPFPTCHRRLGRPRSRLGLEALESRLQPSIAPLTIVESEPNNTLPTANPLNWTWSTPAGALGQIGTGASASADVDWYRFELTSAGQVRFRLDSQQNDHFLPVLGLYDDSAAGTDLSHPFGNRLLDQSLAEFGRGATIERLLAPGVYYLAVSGEGNRAFHPMLADSGLEGSSGAYHLQITGTEAGLDPANGPVVFTVDTSTVMVRIGLSTLIDPGSLMFDSLSGSVRLIYHPTGEFGDGRDVPVELQWGGFTPSSEIQIVPTAALQPGAYRVVLAGDSEQNLFVIRDLMGTPLGATLETPLGHDTIIEFRIHTVEGRSPDAPSNDTSAGAIRLGDLTGSGLIQVPGIIGDDPAYRADFLPVPPGSDVDLYRFTISGPGRHALVAEVFAGRIGSALDSGLSLFRRDADGRLVLVASNDNTLNTTAAGWFVPLFTDSVLHVGLEAGEYFLAVSSGLNVPTADGSSPYGLPIFDPEVPHSGFGFSTGHYILNLLIQADQTPPTVVGSTPVAGSVVTSTPTHVQVRFSETVNLQTLAALAFSDPTQPAAFYLRGSDGVDRPLRLNSYDPVTSVAEFLVLDAMPNGWAELRFNGTQRLTDLAGLPLMGSTPSGEFVVRFQIDGPERGSEGDPRVWIADDVPDHLDEPQELGALFPLELQSGVIVRRLPGTTGTEDVFRYKLLQSRQFVLQTAGNVLPELYDAEGNLLFLFEQSANTYSIDLPAGVYRLRLMGWGDEGYEVTLGQGGSGENPVPLTAGPAPALRIRIIGDTTVPPGAPGSTPGVRPSAGSGETPGGGAKPAVIMPTPSPVVPLPGVFRELGRGTVGGDRPEAATARVSPAVRVDLSGPSSKTTPTTVASSGGEGEDQPGGEPERPRSREAPIQPIVEQLRNWTERLLEMGWRMRNLIHIWPQVPQYPVVPSGNAVKTEKAAEVPTDVPVVSEVYEGDVPARAEESGQRGWMILWNPSLLVLGGGLFLMGVRNGKRSRYLRPGVENPKEL